jgi:hypothetical protein
MVEQSGAMSFQHNQADDEVAIARQAKVKIVKKIAGIAFIYALEKVRQLIGTTWPGIDLHFENIGC